MITQTFAPAITILVPSLIFRLLVARAKASSTSVRIRYHPSVSSSVGCGSRMALPLSSISCGAHQIDETANTIGRAGVASRSKINRRTGRWVLFKSRS